MVDRLKEAAQKEKRNRELMREYEKKYDDNWGGFRKWWDSIFGEGVQEENKIIYPIYRKE